MHFQRTLLALPVAFTFACSQPSSDVAVAQADAAASVVTDVAAVATVEPPAPAPVIAKESPPEPKTLLEVEALFHDEPDRDFFDEGKSLVASGKPGEAVDAFRKALFTNPQAKTWAALGDAYIRIGDSERGAQSLEEALETEPGRINVRESLVKAYLKDGDVGAARVHAEKLAQLDTTSASSHYLLGKAYMKSSMWEQAIASFDRSLEIAPAFSHAHNNLGFSALMVGKTELAVEHLEATIDLDPVEPYMLNNLGVAYERQGRGPDALAAFLRAVEMKPAYTNAIINRERVRATLTAGEHQLALEILDELKASPIPTVTTASADPTEDPFADGTVAD
jgi:Flp pilus assembly protein TadD